MKLIKGNVTQYNIRSKINGV